MLMNNAAKGLRRAIANIDINVIAPTIGDTFVNEMLYNPDESIKGDNIVVPRGAAAILIRESAQQRRIQFLQMTANPIDSQIITPKYRAALLRETALAMELPVDDVVPSAEEMDQIQQQQAQQQQQMMQAQQQAEQQKMQHEKDMLDAKLGNETERETMRLQTKSADTASTNQASVLANIVKESVASALAAQAASKKRVKFNYTDTGELAGAETEHEF
jgi:uncharacterized protein YeaO (DUF488 family)